VVALVAGGVGMGVGASEMGVGGVRWVGLGVVGSVRLL